MLGDKKPVVMASDRAIPGGVATLGDDGKLLEAQRPETTVAGVTGLEAALAKKAAKAVPAEAGNVATLDGDGNLQDSGVNLDNVITGEDTELPPVGLALNADTLGGFGPDHYATAESVEKKADQIALTDGLAAKQDKLTGAQGQVVGFDDVGKPVAQDAPESGVNTGTSTDVSGLLKGADGKIAQAVADTDFATPGYFDRKIQSGQSAPETLADGVVYLVYE